MAPRLDRRTLLLAALGGVAGLTACAAPSADVATVGREPSNDDVPEPLAPTAPTDPPAQPRTMVMVGDSITFMSTEPLEVALASTGLQVMRIDAQVGRRMTVGTRGGLHPGTDVVQFLEAAIDPDLWVIALGANDIEQYPDAEAYTEQIDELVRTVPRGAPLVWVNAWHRDALEHCEIFNDALADRLDRRDRTHIVDWYSQGEVDGVVSDDGVHPTESGTEVFALLTAAGVSDLLATL
jgi:lysophospholipase L1-like esterase